MKELTYHWEGDYLIPNLEAPEAPRIGKYGTMRHKYLRSHHRGIFDGMLLEGSLNAHLEEVDRSPACATSSSASTTPSFPRPTR